MAGDWRWRVHTEGGAGFLHDLVALGLVFATPTISDGPIIGLPSARSFGRCEPKSLRKLTAAACIPSAEGIHQPPRLFRPTCGTRIELISDPWLVPVNRIILKLVSKLKVSCGSGPIAAHPDR